MSLDKHMKQIRTTRSHRERGAAAIEAALILPMFFACLFGVLEAGRFMNTEQVLTNAAREGARFSVTPLTGTNALPTTNEVTTYVQQYLDAAGVAGTVTVFNSDPPANYYTRVRVDGLYQLITWQSFNMLSVTLRGEAKMRNETSD
jgi:Flp pilus assembly protein TadG